MEEKNITIKSVAAELKKMTVRDVAFALGYAPDYLRKVVKEMFPDSVFNGKETMLTEPQVVLLKNSLVPRTLDMKVQGENAITDLEMLLLDKKVSDWKTKKINELQLELQEKEIELIAAKPKVESFNALMRSDQTMSITDAAKHFGLHPKLEVFPYLRDNGYLTQKDLPTQAAIDAGYLALRETKCRNDEVRMQAVVLTSQLETWRIRVIPQIKAWEAAS